MEILRKKVSKDEMGREQEIREIGEVGKGNSRGGDQGGVFGDRENLE